MDDTQMKQENSTSGSDSSIQQILLESDSVNKIKSDKKLADLKESDNRNLSKHNKQYTRLLKAYISNYEANAEQKRQKKESVFQLAMGLLIISPMILMIFLAISIGLIANGVDANAFIPQIVAAFGTTISCIFVVFKIITKYLFDKNEEKNMAAIISKIQKYDTTIRGNTAEEE